MKQETFDKIYNKIIISTFDYFNERTGDLYLSKQCCRDIKVYYEELVAFSKLHYMSPNTKKLNRHKVAAAMMIAILKAKPIKKVGKNYYLPDANGETSIWPFNESLAITVALSLLRAFILERVKVAFSKKGDKIPRVLFESVTLQDSIIFKEEIPITVKERQDWEWELYQIRQDGAYNLLAMAHILNYIEKNARLQFFIDNPDQEPQYSPNLSDDDLEECSSMLEQFEPES